MLVDVNEIYVRAMQRAALLDAQAKWLEEADDKDASLTTRTIARVIADAFHQEAELYKEPRTKETNDDNALSAWDDVHGVAPETPTAGT